MYLKELNIINFKNYEEAHISFSPEINCLVGPNGCGKTNLLDAIHYLSMTRSAISSVESQNVKHGERFFMILGFVDKKEKVTRIHAGYQQGKKSFSIDKKEYERLSEHIGKFPSVLIVPHDTDLVREGSEERRKFFDSIISQADAEYLQQLIRYNKLLKQRNSLLRQYHEYPLHLVDQDLFAVYDEPLSALNVYIYEKRNSFIKAYNEQFQHYYSFLTDNAEEVSLSYKSDVGKDDFLVQFKESFSKDIMLQRTTKGIHKDDYDFKIQGYSLKKYGSQGQQKSYVIALKLAQFELIKQLVSTKPVLLLDDIFDKLDDHRIQKLLQLVADHQFGQIFVTDAREERTRQLLSILDAEVKFLNVKDIKNN
ncbi:DNA replication/repair protein RecF [Algivirga pacifica]|uniref:DNA replication and repair protein RecF n=1 Tax=Algivirga pacifica TaxID=1162670 RepID=A0ABP9D9G2_9BACT